jgi:ribosome biogenesis GTPase
VLEIEKLGWDPEWQGVFAPHAAEGLRPARVVAEDRGSFVVDDGGGGRRSDVSGRLRYEEAEGPAVGDWVALRAAEFDGTAVIAGVLPRRTSLGRKAAGRATARQVVAANVDVAFVVCGLDGDFNVRRIERALVLVREGGVRPVVVLNKADTCADAEPRRREVESAAPGMSVHVASARTGDGLEALKAELGPGRTAVLLGSSGAGKSTILNRLLGEERQLTAAVREDDSRGRHTTTRRQLFVLPGGGLIVDTPGLRELQLWAGEEAVDEAFLDLGALAAGCRFADCAHGREPGCAVREAVAAGTLAPERLASYHKLQRERRHLETRVDGRRRQEETRRVRSLHRLARRHRPRG